MSDGKLFQSQGHSAILNWDKFGDLHFNFISVTLKCMLNVSHITYRAPFWLQSTVVGFCVLWRLADKPNKFEERHIWRQFTAVMRYTSRMRSDDDRRRQTCSQKKQQLGLYTKTRKATTPTHLRARRCHISSASFIWEAVKARCCCCCCYRVPWHSQCLKVCRVYGVK